MPAMTYDNDIFISYAHLDNQPLVRDTEGWVSQFHRAIEIRVDQLLGKRLSVWRDPKLQGNDFFDDTIVQQMPSVAVLVSVFSPRYVQSTSCTRELNQFCQASEKFGGLRHRDKMRIFKVLKTPVPIEEHPQQVRDCLGYEFYKLDSVSGKIRELNQIFGGDAEREFWIKLDDLAQDLCALLRSLERDEAGNSKTGDNVEESTVFLADCTFDVREQYEDVRRDLLGHHCRVLPNRPLPLDVAELRPALKDMLNQCSLSVHVIGGSYGIVPEGTDKSVVELQNEIAMEREELGSFTRLVWIPPGMKVDDPRQEQFIETLRTDPRIQQGADLLETPLEDLNTQIHNKLIPEPTIRVGPEKAHDASEVQLVYLMCDARDAESVAPVADCLYEHGCDVLLPAFDGDEAQVRADNEESLRSADAVLIYYGAPNELWLRGKLREWRKSAAFGRTKPLKATAVFVAPPNSRREDRMRMHEARVIRQPDRFSESLLEPFLADLRV